MPAITVRRMRYIAASPSAIFSSLCDPQELTELMPRVRRIDLLERGPDHARVATHMALGPFGEIRNEGTVRWQEGREVTFTSKRPIPVSTHWQLTPIDGGTEVEVSLTLDLTPMLGFMAAFVPSDQVINMIGPDLDTALRTLERRANTGLLEREHGA